MSGGIKYIPLTFVSSSAEKERLIRNTVLLRYFASESEVEVPLLHYIESTQYGFNASAKDSGTHRFVRISDISNGEIAWDTVPFCECDSPEPYLLKRHDIVVARTGGTTGKSYMVSTPPEGSIYAGYLIRVRANSETNPSFLSVFLNSYHYWSQITSLNRDEFRPSVNAEKLKELRLPKFDRAVQDQIARLSNNPTDGADSSINVELSAVLGKRNTHESIVAEIDKQQSLLAKLKQAILQEAIQGKLTADWRAAHPDVEPASQLLNRIQAEKARLIGAKKLRPEKPLPKITPSEIPFEIPKRWEWCRLGDILNFSSGDGLTAAQMAGGDIPVFGGNGINGYHDKANIETETIVVGRVGANCGAVHKTPAKAWVTDNAFITTFSESCLTMDFLVLLLHYLNLNHLSYNGSQPVISGKRVYPLTTPLPPLAEQAEIMKRVEALMETCRTLETEIAQARTHAAHLLQAVLKEAFAPAA